MDLDITHAEALRLIDRAVMAIQSTYAPGRPAFSALERVHRELMRARFEFAPPDLEGVVVEWRARA